jgi:1-acyl-sn-glycerol-3-phosphate acyltransferase
VKEFDYSQVKHYKLYNFIKVLFRPLLKLLYHLNFKGLENVPNDDGTKYIVAINHTCAFDPLFVACHKDVPPLHFMGKAELFKNPISAWFLTHM